MVKFYNNTSTYDYSFPAVSLAYFLRYPNPHSTHVLSTDVISRTFDTTSHKLTTVRLHLKRSKIPPAVLKLVPASFFGAGKDGESRTFILEKSTVDIKTGVMETESRNLEWTGVLSVVERQTFRRRNDDFVSSAMSGVQGDLFSQQGPQLTDVTTAVTLHSRIGENLRKRRAAKLAEQEAAAEEEPTTSSGGWFKSLTNGPMQRAIEVIGLKRAERSQPKAKEGMKVVLERMREGGLVAVLEGMRKDRELMFTGPA